MTDAKYFACIVDYLTMIHHLKPYTFSQAARKLPNQQLCRSLLPSCGKRLIMVDDVPI